MDFQSLSRKELQALCKKNKIPANITNVAMADALAALQEVSGIEEILNPIESESQQSELRIENGSSENSHTACRTSTRRKPVKEEPPTTQSITRTRRGRVGEMADQVNKDLNVLPTPISSSRRRAPVASARERPETQMIEHNIEEKEQKNEDRERSDVLETPSIPKTHRKVAGTGLTRRKTECGIEKSTVHGVCSTRRSIRLLEKNMEKLNLKELGSLEPNVAYNLFHKLPEGKGLGEQKTNESDAEEMSDSKPDAQKKIGSDAMEEEESGDAEGKNEKKEQMNDNGKECEEADESKEKAEVIYESNVKEYNDGDDNNTNDKEPQSHATTEDQNEMLTMEKHNENSVDLEQNMGITMQNEVMEETSQIFVGENEQMVEFSVEDLVDIMEAEFLEASNQKICEKEKQLAGAQNSISEPGMENGNKSESLVGFQKFHEGHHFVDDDSTVREPELVENFNSMDSISEPKMEDLSTSESLVEIHVLQNEDNSGMTNVNSMDSMSEPKMDALSRSEKSSVEFQVFQVEVNSGMANISREISFAADELPGKFPRPKAEVSVEESRTCLKTYNSGDEEEDIKNYSSDEEKKLSLRQLRKMIKELELTKKSNKEKTNGKVEEKVVRTVLQSLPENCMAKDGEDKTTPATANSEFFQ